MLDSKWFFMFMFGVFAVEAITNVIQDKHPPEDVQIRCQMAFNMATNKNDSVMINIANSACKYEWTSDSISFSDTRP